MSLHDCDETGRQAPRVPVRRGVAGAAASQSGRIAVRVAAKGPAPQSDGRRRLPLRVA